MILIFTDSPYLEWSNYTSFKQREFKEGIKYWFNFDEKDPSTNKNIVTTDTIVDFLSRINGQYSIEYLLIYTSPDSGVQDKFDIDLIGFNIDTEVFYFSYSKYDHLFRYETSNKNIYEIIKQWPLPEENASVLRTHTYIRTLTLWANNKYKKYHSEAAISEIMVIHFEVQHTYLWLYYSKIKDKKCYLESIPTKVTSEEVYLWKDLIKNYDINIPNDNNNSLRELIIKLTKISPKKFPLNIDKLSYEKILKFNPIYLYNLSHFLPTYSEYEVQMLSMLAFFYSLYSINLKEFINTKFITEYDQIVELSKRLFESDDPTGTDIENTYILLAHHFGIKRCLPPMEFSNAPLSTELKDEVSFHFRRYLTLNM